MPEARRAIAAVRHALDVGRRAAHGEGGELRIGYAEDLGPRLFQIAVPALTARLPALHVTPVAMSTPDQLTELREHRLDIAFGWMPELTAELNSLLVTREPLVVALDPHHPLAQQSVIDPADLSGQPLVLVDRQTNPRLHDHYVHQLEARGATVTIHSYSSSLDQVLTLVLSGTALGLTTSSAAASRPYDGVVYRPLTEPSPYADHTLVWRRATTTNDAVTAFVDIVRELRDSATFLPTGPDT